MKSWSKRTVIVLGLCCLVASCAKGNPDNVSVYHQSEAIPTYVAVDDLDGIVNRGIVRVLVHGVGETHLARDGKLGQRDRELVAAVADTLGVRLKLILVENYADLIPMLLDGRGDIVAAQMTVTPKRRERVAFTRPTRSVDEVLVGKRGAASAPKSLTDLMGREVHVRQSSS
ncbi:MAG: transporter substrate-binding domain-containing protein, partial [Myxococcota bacterium]|nr:transporter substrate-binding domain-containing protein [Myxococcota bacterium]